MSRYISYEFYKMTLASMEEHLSFIEGAQIANPEVDTYKDGLSFAVKQMKSLEPFVIEINEDDDE